MAEVEEATKDPGTTEVTFELLAACEPRLRALDRAPVLDPFHVVKVGSQMIDGSIRTKLNTLAHAMKG